MARRTEEDQTHDPTRNTVIAGSTHGLGESMARLVRGPDWARMGTNEVEAPNTVDEAGNPAAVEVVA
jgi:hypothetical protein